MIVREITCIKIDERSHTESSELRVDGQIGARRDPLKIGDLTDNRFLDI